MSQYRNYKKISDFYLSEEQNKFEEPCLNGYARTSDSDQSIVRQNDINVNNTSHMAQFKNFRTNIVQENFETIEPVKPGKKIPSSSPAIFGPPMWFTLHNGAAYYPSNPSPMFQERMKFFILGIPIMVPCLSCREHSTAYIEKHMVNLDDICSSRENLFKFFFEFHNHVNRMLGKPEMSYDVALKMYS